jgi:hypothetical protein
MNSQRSTLNPVKQRGVNAALRSQRTVELHVDELVLDGFAPGDRHVIGDAVEWELRRLLTKQLPMQQESFTQDCIRGRQIHLYSGIGAHEVGVEVGRSVFASLSTYSLGERTSPQRFARVNEHNVHDNQSAQINKKGT